MKPIPPEAVAALESLLEVYPELRGLVSVNGDTASPSPVQVNLPEPDCCRSPAWVCFRNDRQKTWYVRWYTPDPTRPYSRRYRWRAFGKTDEARAKAEAFHAKLLPELARQWAEFTNAGAAMAEPPPGR